MSSQPMSRVARTFMEEHYKQAEQERKREHEMLVQALHALQEVAHEAEVTAANGMEPEFDALWDLVNAACTHRMNWSISRKNAAAYHEALVLTE